MHEMVLRLVLLGAWAITAQGQQCDCSPCREYPEEDFSPDPCFDKCIVTGDPHVEHSWRPGFENGFDFQPQGIWRLAKTDTCGGPVEVQAFFCHYFFTRLSSAIAYAITINGGDKYIIKRVGDEFQVGSPDVRGFNVSFQGDPVSGRLLVSDDKCVRIKMNTVPLYDRRTRFLDNPYLNNIFMNIWECATTQEGICGAPKLSKEWIDPESDENLFKTSDQPDLWKDLCEFCQEGGQATTPPGCPAPPGGEEPGEPGCEFLRPYGSIWDKECVPQPGDSANNALLKELQDGGENCVAFARLNNGPKFPGRSCRDWCQDRGAECVTVRDDIATGKFPTEDNSNACQLTEADHPNNFIGGDPEQPKTCDTVSRDTHCVCKKPDNPAPGESVEKTCLEARDEAGFNFSHLDAADLCRREAMWFQRVTYPRNTEQTTFEQRLLLYCAQDVCATDPEDRPEVARIYQDRDPDLNDKPNVCNGPLLCNVVCSSQLIENWGECLNRCEAHRSKLIHAVTRYCKAGICTAYLEETETIGLLQHRRSNRSEIMSSRRSWESRRSSRRSWSRRRKGDDDGSTRRRKSDDDDGSGRRRKGDDDGSGRRRKGDDDDGSGSTRRRKGDDDDGSGSTRRRKGDDDDGSGNRRRKGDDDDGSGNRRRKGDDDDGSGNRRRKGDDDDGSGNRRRKGKGDDDIGDDDVPDDGCVDKQFMCNMLCSGMKLEGRELSWCKHRCTSKFTSQIKPGLDHYCKECKNYCEHPPATTTTTTTTTTTAVNNECKHNKVYFTTSTTSTTTHPPYPKDDDDKDDSRRRKDDSRRRKGDDDDGSGTRRRKGDDDGSRRRKGDDDDGSGTRRRKGDDDGSRRRKYSHHRRHYKDGDD